MSTLLTTTMPTMKSSIEALKKAGVRENAAVMIDDAPETQNYADEIGADIYVPDEPLAAGKTKEDLCKGVVLCTWCYAQHAHYQVKIIDKNLSMLYCSRMMWKENMMDDESHGKGTRWLLPIKCLNWLNAFTTISMPTK
ncbi:MAG: hypothetical protein GY801_34425, partial [bacterium]|nr:hypothetical protein [bacterium]